MLPENEIMDPMELLKNRIQDKVSKTLLPLHDIYKQIGISPGIYYRFIAGKNVGRMALIKLEKWLSN